METGRRYYRFYGGAVLFAWAGNSCYAIFAEGNALHDMAPLPVALSLVLFSFVHGAHRYGVKAALAFFAIVVAIGWSVESIGVLTGLPFGAYRYAPSMLPFVGGVPLSVLFAYFAMSYPAWTVASMLIGRFDNRFERREIGATAALAAALMVCWDFSMDPLRATLEGRWEWAAPGLYLGIPATNFAGWFITAWLMFRAFGAWLLVSRHSLPARRELGHWQFWAAAALIYLSFCGEYLLNPLFAASDLAGSAMYSAGTIHRGAALAALLTMAPAAALAIVRCVQELRGGLWPQGTGAGMEAVE